MKGKVHYSQDRQPPPDLPLILRVGLSSDESESVLLFDALW